MLLSALLLALAAQLIPPVKPELAARFEQLEWKSEEDTSAPTYRYRLYVPPAANGGNRMPMLVWFHGYNERGTDNVKQLTWLDLLFEQASDAPPLFILAVQHPQEGTWSSSGGSSPTDPLTVTTQIMGDVMRDYAVDRSRVYASGVSAGGTACWEIALRNPELFAAIAPLAAGGSSPGRARELANIATWAFHSANDTRPSPDGARSMVNAIRAAGGAAHLTLTEPNMNWAHDCWRGAFRNHDLLDWMLAQRRGALVLSWRPGETQFPFWTYGIWAGIAAVLILAIESERRRRGRPPQPATASEPGAVGDEVGPESSVRHDG